MDIVVNYPPVDHALPKGHSCRSKWEETEYFCPHCGVKAVWVGDDADYDSGPSHGCLNCGHFFAMAVGGDPRPAGCEWDEQILTQLRTGVTQTPID